MPGRKFEIKEAVSFAWKSVWGNVWFWISLVLISAIVSWLNDSISRTLYSEPAKASLDVIYFFISAFISLGITKISLNLIDKKRSEYSDFVTSAKTYFNYIFATIIYSLIVLVGIILLVAPGIIWALQYSMYPYLILEKGYGPIEALKKSLEITRGERIHLLVLCLCFLGIIILGALALFVGLLIAVPITWITMAYVYKKLMSKSHAKVKDSK